LHHEHHEVRRQGGGSNHPDNLTLLHLYCHQAIHGRTKVPTDEADVGCLSRVR
jgi:hypothetical protein